MQDAKNFEKNIKNILFFKKRGGGGGEGTSRNFCLDKLINRSKELLNEHLIERITQPSMLNTH